MVIWKLVNKGLELFLWTVRCCFSHVWKITFSQGKFSGLEGAEHLATQVSSAVYLVTWLELAGVADSWNCQTLPQPHPVPSHYSDWYMLKLQQNGIYSRRFTRKGVVQWDHFYKIVFTKALQEGIWWLVRNGFLLQLTYTANPRITRLIRSKKSSRNTKTRKVNNW